MLFNENETISQFIDDPGMQRAKKFDQSQDFDAIINSVIKKLEKIEKEWVLGEFDGVRYLKITLLG